MGVRRAVEMVLESPTKHELPIYTYGPLIHNPQVLNILEEKGISILKDIPDRGKGTVLIRAHGVPPQTKESLKQAGFSVIDATCPRVIKVQTIIKKHAEQGFDIIIVGDQDHPEVVGLLGYAAGKGHVVKSLDELKLLPIFNQAIIVAQTTQNLTIYEAIKEWVSKEYPHYKIFDTICDSTEKRQEEVKRLAQIADAVVVVGGRNSGNTHRLAEIAHQSGKPAFHIESDDELKLDLFQHTKVIAVTAGASTPNWVIRKVCRTLEFFSLTGKKNWLKSLLSLQRILLLTNIYVALGAGCLCYTCARLQGLSKFFYPVLVSILYVLSMHTLNNLTGTKADRYNDPDRADFYFDNKFFLSLLAVIAGGTGLIAAYDMGWLPFILLFTMSLLGLSYNLKILPNIRGKIRSIRDIPGSKTVLIAIAWGLVTSVIPAIAEHHQIGIKTFLVFAWSASMVFVRTAFYDILDIQGDRIVGKETIPILLGEAKSIQMLKILLVFQGVLLAVAGAINILSPALSFLLMICPLSMYGVLMLYEKDNNLPGLRFEFLIESHFILTGVISVLSSQ